MTLMNDKKAEYVNKMSARQEMKNESEKLEQEPTS